MLKVFRGSRLFVKVVMVLSGLAFLGSSVAFVIGSGFQDAPAPAPASPSAQQANRAEVSEREKLQAQVRGYALVLEREPDNQTALRSLIELKIRLGDLKGAIPYMTTLADTNPQQTGYRLVLAQALGRTGDFQGAEQTYRQVLEKQPGEPEALQGLTSLWIEQQKPEEAIAFLQETLERAKTEPERIDGLTVLLVLGEAFVRMERYDSAIATFQEAAQGAPQDFRPVFAEALVLKRQERTEEAKVLFEQAEALAPEQYKSQVREQATQTTSPEPTAPQPTTPEQSTPPAQSQGEQPPGPSTP